MSIKLDILPPWNLNSISEPQWQLSVDLKLEKPRNYHRAKLFHRDRLAKMTVGDFALTSGQFVYTDDKAFDKNRSVASFRYMRTAAHCKAKEVAADTEFFGIKLDVISTIK